MALAAALGLCLGGCDEGPTSQGKAERSVVVADVNGEVITKEQLDASLMAEGQSPLPSVGSREALKALVDQLIERRLILQGFRERGEPVDEAQVRQYVEIIGRQQPPSKDESTSLEKRNAREEAWRRAVRETLEVELLLAREIYSQVKVSDQEIRSYYEKHQDRFHSGRRWRMRHILVEKEEEARRLRELVRKGVSFARLAEENSIGIERARGGDMGFFAEGQLPKSIEDVVRSLKGDEVSRVVRTDAGYHIFQITERRSAGLLPLSAVQEQVRAEIVARKGRERLNRWLADRKARSTIRYFWRNLENVGAG